MTVLANNRRESQAVIGFAKAWIVAAAQQHVSGRAVAVRRPQITERIEHQAERVHLAEAMLLHAGSVREKAVAVARVHSDGAAIAAHDGGIVVETVVGINPSVEAAAEIARQAM